MRILGVDEAGRGCIIGNLYIAGAVVPEEANDELRAMGVRDSKLVSPKKRDALAEKLASRFPIVVMSIPPEEIDAGNLNTLEAVYTGKIIEALAGKYDRVVVDCPSNNTEAYRRQLRKLCGVDVSAEHKADVNHVSASLASIMAKAAREAALRELQTKYAHLGDFGSGYTSDARTQEFLRANIKGECDHIFRKSWSTYSFQAKGLVDPCKEGLFAC